MLAPGTVGKSNKLMCLDHFTLTIQHSHFLLATVQNVPRPWLPVEIVSLPSRVHGCLAVACPCLVSDGSVGMMHRVAVLLILNELTC